jgi:hypothetical protein
MKKMNLIDSLVYLDRDYISSAYEAITGSPSSTQITKTEAKKAGAGIPIFSAEISAGETRSFTLSSVAMLDSLIANFESYPTADSNSGARGQASQVVWFHGNMSVFKVTLSNNAAVSSAVKPSVSEKYFRITLSDQRSLALLTTPEYFTSGFYSLIKIYDTLLEENLIPVRGLARLLPANTSFKEIIAVPLFIYEEVLNENPVKL